MRVLLSILLNALAIYVAAYLLDGIALSGTAATLIAGLVLGIVNTIVKPVLILLTLPITIVTLGLFLFVVNAICLALTAALVPGFEICGVLERRRRRADRQPRRLGSERARAKGARARSGMKGW